MYPAAAYTPVAAAAPRVTVVFWSCDSGNHGAIAPRARNAKKASPSTSTLGSYRSASRRATVDLPAPGGPVSTSNDDTIREASVGAVASAENSTRAQSFGSIARDYDRFRPAPPADAVAWIVPEECELAVDIGAGTGALTRRLLERVPKVVSVEPDERMRTILHERAPATDARAGTAEAIPVPDA